MLTREQVAEELNNYAEQCGDYILDVDSLTNMLQEMFEEEDPNIRAHVLNWLANRNRPKAV